MNKWGGGKQQRGTQTQRAPVLQVENLSPGPSPETGSMVEDDGVLSRALSVGNVLSNTATEAVPEFWLVPKC